MKIQNLDLNDKIVPIENILKLIRSKDIKNVILSFGVDDAGEIHYSISAEMDTSVFLNGFMKQMKADK